MHQQPGTDSGNRRKYPFFASKQGASENQGCVSSRGDCQKETKNKKRSETLLNKSPN